MPALACHLAFGRGIDACCLCQRCVEQRSACRSVNFPSVQAEDNRDRFRVARSPRLNLVGDRGKETQTNQGKRNPRQDCTHTHRTEHARKRIGGLQGSTHGLEQRACCLVEGITDRRAKRQRQLCREW